MSCLHPAVRAEILLWQVDLLLCSPICCSVQEAIEEPSVVLKGPAVAGKPLDCCVLYFWGYVGLGGLTWHQREGRCFCCKTWECGGAPLLLLWQQLMLCSLGLNFAFFFFLVKDYTAIDAKVKLYSEFLS